MCRTRSAADGPRARRPPAVFSPAAAEPRHRQPRAPTADRKPPANEARPRIAPTGAYRARTREPPSLLRSTPARRPSWCPNSPKCAPPRRFSTHTTCTRACAGGRGAEAAGVRASFRRPAQILTRPPSLRLRSERLRPLAELTKARRAIADAKARPRSVPAPPPSPTHTGAAPPADRPPPSTPPAATRARRAARHRRVQRRRTHRRRQVRRRRGG